MSLLSRVLHTEKERVRPLAPSVPFSMAIELESPPVVLYGPPKDSSGSIVSGLLSLDIKVGKSIELDQVTLALVQTIHYARPFVPPLLSVLSCHDCTTKRTELARWDVVTARANFASGMHAYPFSHLLPGLLPASSKLGSAHSHSYIKYDLIATAYEYQNPKHVVVKLPLNISRSVLRGPDRNSLRVFPPTEVAASAVLPSVVYPKLNFPIELRLDNIVSKSGDRRWRMRRLNWKIEEHVKIRATTCDKHRAKLDALEESQRKMELQRELRSGAHQGPSKSLGLHHSTIQSSMYLSTGEELILVPMEGDRDDIAEAETEQEPDVGGIADDFAAMLQPVSSARSHVSASTSTHSPAILTALSPVMSTQSGQLPYSLHSPSHAGPLLYLDELRTISHGEIKSGWKSDFSGRGNIELVAEIAAIKCSTGFARHTPRKTSHDVPLDEMQQGLRGDANISCDIEDPALGIFVNHTLIVEVIVAEELVHQPKNQDASAAVSTPTGAARVLRMQFRLNMTERSGLGIAWDDEVPPTYEDVRTLSPPTYTPTPLATPAVLYGLGNTPIVGTYGQDIERIQELLLDEELSRL